MAIQVGGTQVISNSQGLTNIASVDSTTAASITSAGVGGGWSQQSTGTLSGLTPEITIPNADFVRIKIRFSCNQNIGETFLKIECLSNVLITGESSFDENSFQLPRVSFLKK